MAPALFKLLILCWVSICVVPTTADAFPAERNGEAPLSGAHTALAVIVGVASVLGLVYALFNCSCCDESSLLKYEETPEEDDTAAIQDDDFSPPTESTPVNAQKAPEEETMPVTNLSAAASVDTSAVEAFNDPRLQFSRDQLNYIDEIGSGWFGKALRGEAEQIHPGMRKTRVVVKQLKDSATPDEQVLFVKEVQPYREVNHPNVMMLLGQCLETSPLLLILEYAPNGDLKAHLQKNRDKVQSFAQDDVQLRMATDVISGLLWLHQKDFVHIDLAARNCQVCADDVIKIGDYGTSLEQYPDDYYKTKDGRHAVPIRWLGPEVINAESENIEPEKVTKQSNIWSFGVIMLELSTAGDTPYPELSDEEVLQKIVRERQVQLDKPNLAMKYADRWFETMAFCFLDEADRPSTQEVHDLMQHLNTYKDQLNQADFDSRWNALRPAAVRESDSSIDIPQQQVVEEEIMVTPESQQLSESPPQIDDEDFEPRAGEVTNPFMKEGPIDTSTPMPADQQLVGGGDDSSHYVTATGSFLDTQDETGGEEGDKTKEELEGEPTGGDKDVTGQGEDFNTMVEAMMDETMESLKLEDRSGLGDDSTQLGDEGKQVEDDEQLEDDDERPEDATNQDDGSQPDDDGSQPDDDGGQVEAMMDETVESLKLEDKSGLGDDSTQFSDGGERVEDNDEQPEDVTNQYEGGQPDDDGSQPDDDDSQVEAMIEETVESLKPEDKSGLGDDSTQLSDGGERVEDNDEQPEDVTNQYEGGQPDDDGSQPDDDDSQVEAMIEETVESLKPEDKSGLGDDSTQFSDGVERVEDNDEQPEDVTNQDEGGQPDDDGSQPDDDGSQVEAMIEETVESLKPEDKSGLGDDSTQLSDGGERVEDNDEQPEDVTNQYEGGQPDDDGSQPDDDDSQVEAMIEETVESLKPEDKSGLGDDSTQFSDGVERVEDNDEQPEDVTNQDEGGQPDDDGSQPDDDGSQVEAMIEETVESLKPEDKSGLGDDSTQLSDGGERVEDNDEQPEDVTNQYEGGQPDDDGSQPDDDDSQVEAMIEETVESLKPEDKSGLGDDSTQFSDGVERVEDNDEQPEDVTNQDEGGQPDDDGSQPDDDGSQPEAMMGETMESLKPEDNSGMGDDSTQLSDEGERVENNEEQPADDEEQPEDATNQDDGSQPDDDGSQLDDDGRQRGEGREQEEDSVKEDDTVKMVSQDENQNEDAKTFHSEAGIAIAEPPAAPTTQPREESPPEPVHHGYAQVEKKEAAGPKKLTITVSSGHKSKTLEIDNLKPMDDVSGSPPEVVPQEPSAGSAGDAPATLTFTIAGKKQDEEEEEEPQQEDGPAETTNGHTQDGLEKDEDNVDRKRGKLDFSVVYDDKKRELQCMIHRAHSLKAMDPNGFSDPYVKLHILPRASSRSTKLRTKTKYKTLDPEYNEELTYHGIIADDLHTKTLRLSMWDEDALGHNDFIGEYLLPLKKLPINETKSYSMFLQDKSEEDEEISESERGKILLGLQYYEKTNQIGVKIIRCVGLFAMDSNGYSDPYVKLYLQPDPQKKTKKKTATKKKTLNPEYKETFMYKLPPEDVHTKTLEVTVWDKDVGSNDYMGGLQLGSTTRGDRRQHWTDAIENPEQMIERWHILSETQFTEDD